MQQIASRRITSDGAWWKDDRAVAASVAIDASPGFLAALAATGMSLLLSSRQDSLVATIGVENSECRVRPVRAPMPMGLALHGDLLAMGTGGALRIYTDLSPDDPDVAHYLPVGMHVTGALSVHDVGWGGNQRLWFVNTRFSALCTVDAPAHFRVRWRPDFVRDHHALDACHLNGMAFVDGEPRYVTALAASDGNEGWRAHGPDAGLLMDTDQNVLCRGLSLPHSPVLHAGRLWMLESGRGRVVAVDPADGAAATVATLPGVARGLAFAGPYAFVATSRVRASSGAVGELLARRFPDADTCRVHVLDARSGAVLGTARLPMVAEVSTLLAIPRRRVVVLEPNAAQTASTLVWCD